MAITGSYIAGRIVWVVFPSINTYGQWVEERVIPLASQLEQIAKKYQQETYDHLMSQPAGEDYCGDGSDEAEYAVDAGISFYENITAMFQGTLNLFTVGLFHVVEQQLSDLTREDTYTATPYRGLEDLEKRYAKTFGVDLKQFPSWAVINELRLVANATKHGEGKASEELRGLRPQLFQNPVIRVLEPNSEVIHVPLAVPLGGDGLYVTDDDFRNYYKASLDLFHWLRQHFEEHGDDYYPG